MKKILLILLLVLLAQSLNAQKYGLEKIDSLKHKLELNKNDDSSNVCIYSEIAYAYSVVEPRIGIEYANKGILIAKNIDDKIGLAKNLHSLGLCYYQKGQFILALDNFFKALKLNEEINNGLELSKNYNSIGLVYFAQKEYKKALEYFFEANQQNDKLKPSTKEKNNLKGRMKYFINIANAYDNLDSIDKSLNYYNQAFQIAEELNNKEGIAKSLSNIGVIYKRQKKYELAYDCFQKSYKIHKDIADNVGEMYNLMNLASLFLEIYKDSTCRSSLKDLLTQNINEQNILEIYAFKAVEKAKSKNAYAELSDLYQLLSEYYDIKKNWTKALYYLNLEKKYYDSAFNEETKANILNLEAKRANDLKDKEIELLTKDKEHQSNRARYFSIIIGIIGIIIIIVLYFLIKNRRSNVRLIQQKSKILEAQKNIGIAYNELEIKENQLIEINATKDKFISIISHDLKNPIISFNHLITTLINYFEALNENEKLKYMNSLKNSALNVLKLLESLLNWSKIQNNEINVNQENFKIADVIKDEILLLTDSAGIKEINIKIHFENENFIFADKEMISVVVRNLLSNAIKFSYIGGIIDIFIIDQSDCIEINIQDYGLGIPEDDQEKLFRLDVKYTTKGTSNEKGSGIGLILCKNLIELNGGEIRFKSQVNQGTIFSFTLPKMDK